MQTALARCQAMLNYDTQPDADDPFWETEMGTPSPKKVFVEGALDVGKRFCGFSLVASKQFSRSIPKVFKSSGQPNHSTELEYGILFYIL